MEEKGRDSTHPASPAPTKKERARRHPAARPPHPYTHLNNRIIAHFFEMDVFILNFFSFFLPPFWDETQEEDVHR
jgi:hypothetical protein